MFGWGYSSYSPVGSPRQFAMNQMQDYGHVRRAARPLAGLHRRAQPIRVMRALAAAAVAAALALALWGYIVGASTRPQPVGQVELAEIREPYRRIWIVDGAENW